MSYYYLRLRYLFPVMAGLFLFCGAIPVSGAEYSLKPFITLSEEYTDNFHASRENKETEFITTIKPGLALKYRASFWDWDAAYSLAYHYFAKGNDDDYFANNLSAAGHMRLIDNLLFLDVKDTYDQISLATNRNEGTNADQTDRNYFTISPYLKFKPVPTLELKSGYQYINRHYSGDSDLDYQEHQLFAGATKELLPKWDLLGNIDYAHVIPDSAENHDRVILSCGVRTNYFTDSFISARGGFSWVTFENGHERVNPYWDVQLSHNAAPWSASLRTYVAYNSDILYSASEGRIIEGWLQREYHRSTVKLTSKYTYTLETETDSKLSKESRLNLKGTHQLSEKITGHLDLGVSEYLGYDTTTQAYVDETPYEISAATGLNYAFADRLKASLDYSYANYRRKLDSSSDSITVNRVILSVTKTF